MTDLPYPIGTIDADCLDEVEALVADAAAVEGVGNVHEGGSYYAERIIRRAIAQGSLALTDKGSAPVNGVVERLLRRFVVIEEGTDETGFTPHVEQQLMDLAEEARAALSSQGRV